MLTYLPGQGTEVAVQGKVRGVIEGADFMRAPLVGLARREAGGQRPQEGHAGK